MKFLAALLSCISTGAPLVVKVGKDVVVDNSLFVETLLTIAPTIEVLCPRLCDDLTDGETNLRKYDKKSGVCECFFASGGFRDSRKVAPVSEGVVFFVNRRYTFFYFEENLIEILPKSSLYIDSSTSSALVVVIDYFSP